MDANELARTGALSFRHGGGGGGTVATAGSRRQQKKKKKKNRSRRQRAGRAEPEPHALPEASGTASQQQSPLISLLAGRDLRLLITGGLSLPTVCRLRRVCRELKLWVDGELSALPQPTAVGGFTMVSTGHGLGKHLQNCESLELGAGMRWRARPGGHGMQVRRSDFAVAGSRSGFLVFGGVKCVNKKPIPWSERLGLGGSDGPAVGGGQGAGVIPLGADQFRAGGCAAVALADGRCVVIGPAGPAGNFGRARRRCIPPPPPLLPPPSSCLLPPSN